MTSHDKLEQTTINLRKGDYAFIQQEAARREVKASLLIRYIIATHVDNWKRDPAIIQDLLEDIML